MGCALKPSGPLWLDGLDLARRPALPGDTQADVAIVGAGFTGLWTARHLLADDPTLRVVVLEAEHAGFGASGRNGGWASALFPASLESLTALPGSSRSAAVAQHAAMVESVSEVVAACRDLDVPVAHGGTVRAARSVVQLRRAREETEHAAAWGLTEPVLLDRAEARQRIRAQGTLGATYTPHCAAIHPGLLVRRLAEDVERRGAVLHEGTAVTRIEPGRAVTARGTVRAETIVRATEGFTPRLPGLERAVVPVYSLVIATEPLSGAVWEEIGLAERETFADHRHLIIYGQRTADGRLVFGGRGAPYHLGSQVRPSFDLEPRVFARLRETLVELFPVLSSAHVTHAWGGPLGIARDWCASVGLDRGTGLGWAGGYVGDGVTTTHLAGRTLADLILGHDTERSRLPWVGHRSPGWEPEPLRWIGINAGLRAMSLADAEERATGRSSVIARAMAPLLGGH